MELCAVKEIGCQTLIITTPYIQISFFYMKLLKISCNDKLILKSQTHNGNKGGLLRCPWKMEIFHVEISLKQLVR